MDMGSILYTIFFIVATYQGLKDNSWLAKWVGNDTGLQMLVAISYTFIFLTEGIIVVYYYKLWFLGIKGL